MQEAKRRKLRVITELVINHSSDQHPWFQRARRSRPTSDARNWYVWSDTDHRFAETRIIFNDTEKSNWTWDATAAGLLLAPLLFAPAGSQLRQSAGAPGHDRRSCGAGSISASTGSAWTPFHICASAKEPTTRISPETHAVIKKIRAALDCVCARQAPPRRSQSVAGGRQRVFRRRRRMPHGLSLSADAANLHGDRPGGPLSDRRHSPANAGHSFQLPVGAVPAQS